MRSRHHFGRAIRIIVWASLLLGLLVYLAVAEVPIFTAWTWDEQAWTIVQVTEYQPIRDLWSYQSDRLPETGADVVFEGLFVGALIVTLLGTAAAFWFALQPHPPRRPGRVEQRIAKTPQTDPSPPD